MCELLQFILACFADLLYIQFLSVFTKNAQDVLFLYLTIELSVYFLLLWKCILVKLSMPAVQLGKQGCWRMAQTPVLSILYKIVSLSQTVRQILFMRNDILCIPEDPPAGRGCFQGPCNGNGADLVHLF